MTSSNEPPGALVECFGDYLSPSKTDEWHKIQAKLAIGASVSGIVIYRPPFGVILDIGSGFPAILLATRIFPAPSSPDSLPSVGSPMSASVLRFADPDRQIVLGQP